MLLQKEDGCILISPKTKCEGLHIHRMHRYHAVNAIEHDKLFVKC